MATITFQISSAPLTASKAFNGTDTDMQNILTWAGVAYRAIVDELFNPSHNPAFTPTNGQIGAALSTGTMRAWQDAETKYRNDGSHSAVPPPPPNTFQ
jgi:hypothetical protein